MKATSPVVRAALPFVGALIFVLAWGGGPNWTCTACLLSGPFAHHLGTLEGADLVRRADSLHDRNHAVGVRARDGRGNPVRHCHRRVDASGPDALPLFIALNSVPKVAIAPLFIIWFGTGATPKVAIAFLIAVFAVVIGTALGLRSVSPDQIDLGKALRGSRLKVLLRIKMYCALPTYSRA